MSDMPLDEALRIAQKGADDYRDVPSVSRVLLKHIAALEADRDHWKARAEKAEAELVCKRREFRQLNDSRSR